MHLDPQHINQDQRQRQIEGQAAGLPVERQADGRKQEGKCRHSIAVGAVASPEEGQAELIQRQQQTERPQRCTAGPAAQGQLFAAQQQPKASTHGGQRRDQRQRRGHVSGQVRPVGADQVVEIGRVQRGIGIGGKRFAIQVDQPQRRLLHGEGHDDGSCYDHRQSKACPDRFPLAHTVRPLLLLQQAHKQPYAANRRKQEGLRLDQRRRRKQRKSRPPVAADGRQGGEHQKQRQHAVGLAPCRAVDQHCGAERIQARHERRRRIAQPLAGIAKQHQRARHVAHDGHDLDHQQRGPRALDGIEQQAAGPQEQHISRRIVAEIIRGVEACGAALGHAQAPGGEAVDVHRIARYLHRQHDAHGQRHGHQTSKGADGAPVRAAAFQQWARQQIRKAKHEAQRHKQHRALLPRLLRG